MVDAVDALVAAGRRYAERAAEEALGNGEVVTLEDMQAALERLHADVPGAVRDGPMRDRARDAYEALNGWLRFSLRVAPYRDEATQHLAVLHARERLGEAMRWATLISWNVIVERAAADARAQVPIWSPPTSRSGEGR